MSLDLEKESGKRGSLSPVKAPPHDSRRRDWILLRPYTRSTDLDTMCAEYFSRLEPHNT